MLDSAYDGVSISVAAVRPESRPKAVLQISHGMCGCKERFLPFMEYMAAHGVACVANDHRGHGLSVKNEKDRGYMYKGGYKTLMIMNSGLFVNPAGAVPGMPMPERTEWTISFF